MGKYEPAERWYCHIFCSYWLCELDCAFTFGSLRKTKARPWGKNSMNINPLRKTSRKHEEEWKIEDFVRTCQHLFMELLLLINEAITNDALHCHKTLLHMFCFSLSPGDGSSAHTCFNPCLLLAMAGKCIILLCKNSSKLRILSTDWKQDPTHVREI